MSHEITDKDTGWMFHKPAWHHLFDVGQTRPTTIAHARELSGLTWDVESVPFITLPRLREGARAQWRCDTLVAAAGEWAAPSQRAIVRNDTLDVLGVWSERGTPITNRSGLEWMQALLGATRFEALFSIRGGQQVCLLSEFPDWITVGGDTVRRFLYARLDHSGHGAMQTMATNVRVQCANTDRMAIGEARARDGIYRVRHIGDVSRRLAAAREALNLSAEYGEQFRRFGDRLATQRIAEAELRKALAQLYPAGSQSDRALKSAARRREAVMAIFNGEGERGDTRGNAPGSRWCAYNAIVEYQQHYAPVRTDPRLTLLERREREAERRFIRSTDDPTGTQARALELLTA